VKVRDNDRVRVNAEVTGRAGVARFARRRPSGRGDRVSRILPAPSYAASPAMGRTES
jgi:hypothetical protein